MKNKNGKAVKLYGICRFL